MCGIIGYIGTKNAIHMVMEGLRKLEYRGYDSAGIAYFNENTLEVKRSKGKIKELDNLVNSLNVTSSLAIGHTRWATHGKPTTENAHPHRSNSIVIVHNGIIENYVDLKQELIKEGFVFTSETDTEVLCHLISKFLPNSSLEEAARKAVKKLKGAYAFAAMDENSPDKIVAVRKESPLVIGMGENEFFLASDVPAFLNYSKDVIYLENMEMAILYKDGVIVTDLDGNPIQKNVVTISWSPAMAEKGGYPHFMLKEIYEQPRAIADTLMGRIYPDKGEVAIDEFGLTQEIIRNTKRIYFSACGTSYHASLFAKYMIEAMARVPVDVELASEFRYRNPIIHPDTLFIAITQSGETADTLAAMREAKRLGATTLTICNVIDSTAAREADYVFYTHSGPEIGVASTKAFSTQIIALYLLAIAFASENKKITAQQASELLLDCLALPAKIEKTLELDSQMLSIAKEVFNAKDFLYLGRGVGYPIALEGALKMKETSYIHAEGYPSGELKHGPIALVDTNMPVVALAPEGLLYEKLFSNIQEIKSRGGMIIPVTAGDKSQLKEFFERTVTTESSNIYLNAILLIIPLQLLSYHVSVLRGCDVDQPRNLAKSVTVE
ncbi:MAG: glutamine--fructose-6-phosphate transaminase (isomerizing) [Dissulfurispiraceae bacterium]|jgi:glucosamine--fructose-6-phosphate aminotransferase (isomerizing)|nr:glutamine--fructose-6-phosphate transaminase (isomerizing) [Dissulfurispiraceae bacterium]